MRVPVRLLAAWVVALLVIAGCWAGGDPAAASTPPKVAALAGHAPGFRPMAPVRVLDTRSGLGVTKGTVAAGSTTRLTMTGRAGVPASGVAAVVVNLTVASPRAAGYLTAFASGTPRPTVSNLNFPRSLAVPNQAVVPLGGDGAIALFASAATDLIVDVTGWFPTGGSFHAVSPSRLVDTRIGSGLPAGPRAGGSTARVSVASRSGIPATGVAAVILNLTAVAPLGTGYLTSFPSGTARPATSNLNWTGSTVAGMSMTTPGSDGTISIFTSGRTDLLVDVVGWIAAGSDYLPVPPVRLLDTRSGVGARGTMVPAGGSVDVLVNGPGLVPGSGAAAVEIVVTATRTDSFGSVSVYPTGSARPATSVLNTVPGGTIANSATVKVGAGGSIRLSSSSATDLLVDVAGYWRAEGPLAVTTGGLLTATAGLPFADQLRATGGVPPYTWSAEGLPGGLAASPDGRLSGTATAAGTVQVTARVQDAAGASSTRSFTLTTAVPAGPNGARAVAVGERHACAVLGSGQVRCWGAGARGQLGDGATTGSPTPVAVRSLAGVTSLSAGHSHTCAVTTDGAVWCWGANTYGALGNGTTTDSSVPVQVPLPAPARAVTAGTLHSCALLTDGTAACWGYGGHGELGNGSMTNSFLPVTVGLGVGAVAIAAGSSHTCALSSDGSVRCWGYGQENELGNGATTNSATPVQAVGIGGSTRSLSAGGHRSCVVRADGAATCWGRAPTAPVTSLDVAVSQLAVGGGHSCTALTTGQVRCWGSGDVGQLGNGRAFSMDAPVAVVGLSANVAPQGAGAASIDAAGSATCAVLTDGSAWCWGANDSGQLGSPGASSAVPRRVIGIG